MFDHTTDAFVAAIALAAAIRAAGLQTRVSGEFYSEDTELAEVGGATRIVISKGLDLASSNNLFVIASDEGGSHAGEIWHLVQAMTKLLVPHWMLAGKGMPVEEGMKWRQQYRMLLSVAAMHEYSLLLGEEGILTAGKQIDPRKSILDDDSSEQDRESIESEFPALQQFARMREIIGSPYRNFVDKNNEEEEFPGEIQKWIRRRRVKQ